MRTEASWVSSGLNPFLPWQLSYLDDVTQHLGIKMGQVLDMVALEDGLVPLEQVTELLHQKE